MSSAQRNLQTIDETADVIASEPFLLSEPVPLKEQVAQRLAAHRARRGQAAASEADQRPSRNSTHSRIAAAVAERYANQQSYHAFLAAEAERTMREAEAAAQIAAINAQAIADAQMQLLETLDAAADGEGFRLTPPAPLPVVTAEPATRSPRPVRQVDEAALLPLEPAFADPSTDQTSFESGQFSDVSSSAPALTVRMAKDLPRPTTETLTYSSRGNVTAAARPAVEIDPAHLEAHLEALEEEIDFRREPVFEPAIAPTDIPANLIEFPRQLVAARKARPRLAEGPLREDSPGQQEATGSQLRIFEVESDQISPAPPVSSVEPEWTSILLTSHPASLPAVRVEAAPEFVPTPAPQAAPISLRVMATAVDAVVVGFALLAFLSAAAMTATHFAPAVTFSLATIGLTSAVTFVVFMLFYQALFFTFAEATPGMLYARIGLCTLDDDNPTRKAMRRRIFAGLLACCSLGIGFLWALLDEDGLGWHDRISRMYQRAY